jgi:adenosylcobinamide-GDP ribazoletransferase
MGFLSKGFLFKILSSLKQSLGTVLAAIAFYTLIPVPAHWQLNFTNIARFAPLVGILIGSLLALIDWGLQALDLPLITRSAVVIVSWIGITGGLHLDGAMDTADGLAVTDPKRRLEVMADSVTGAFGVMVAIAIILLKVSALSDFESFRGWGLILAAGWGRVSQQVAIARYPYLKSTGKGSFHKTALRSLWQIVPSVLLLWLIVGLGALWGGGGWAINFGSWAGLAIALLVPAWFNRKVGGQTGDTYGAAVEWTEAIFLVGLAIGME